MSQAAGGFQQAAAVSSLSIRRQQASVAAGSEGNDALFVMHMWPVLSI